MPSKETPSGSCEKAGGGEWTALREALLAKAKEWRRRERHAGSPGEAYVYPFLADELEALAAAAPAPPANFNEEEVFQLLKGRFAVQGNKVAWMTEQLNKLMEVKRKDAAPLPQDGQGAELLGPPRGGSSSDLAGPSNLGAVARQAREYYKTLLNNANMCAAAWLIHEAPIVTEVPSKAEREVATATDGLGVAELRDMLEAACVLAELDEVPAKVTVLRWRAALRGEKKSTPTLPEAVAGNASAPVGEKRQPSGVGEPRVRELAMKHWPTHAKGEPGSVVQEYGVCSCGAAKANGVKPYDEIWADHMVEVFGAREVGEGLREALEAFNDSPLRLDERTDCMEVAIYGRPHATDGGNYAALYRGGNKEFARLVVAAVNYCAALAAPAPKPAPPAEPQIYAMCICSGYHDDGWVNPNCPVHGTLRRAAERKPPR